MSDCISTKELSQNSPNDSNQEKNFQNDFDPEFTKEPPRQPGTIIDFVSQSEDNPSQLQDPDDDGEGCRSIMSEEGLNEDGVILLPGVDESTASKDGANFDLIGSTESGEVSEEEFHGAAASLEKHFDPLVPEGAVDQETQEEFFEDDRSETPLQDEQENELCDKSSDKNDGDLEYVMAGVRITNAALMPLQTEQNTDGELSEEGTSQGLVDECDIENEGELERPSNYGFAKETEKKHAVADDYGELDYEEEEADDCLDKGKPGEDKKRRDRLGSKDASTTKQEEGSNEPEDGKEVVGSKESTTEKKETESGEEEGEEPEEGEEKQEGEEPEEGEKSTDGELDDDDDCEEGEIREPGQKHVFIRPMCRFYTRGNCTWGNNCRFLHPGINDKGNYSMIDQSFPPGPPAMMGPVMGPCIRGPLPPPPGPPGPWIHERLGKRIMPHRPLEAEPEVPLASAPLPAPPTVGEAAASESAWERGLRHAKEIRKNAKRKETDPAFDDKKDADVEDDRPPAPAPVIPPPPPIANPLPPPRDPYYDDLPRYEDEGFYARPPVPLPPPDAWPFRPPPMDPFEMRWMRPLEFPPPPHPDFRLSERERAMRDRRFSPPPRFGRFEPRFFRDGPAREPLPAPPTDTLVRGRGEEWKDPWLRSRSPKRKRTSSSRSGSRGRRRSRSRSRSYSSFSSSSGSSKSRSRSRSSSYSSSYSKSSHSRSSFSSRSSSHSKSRSGSAKKRLPLATTLGQSIMEKHGKTGDGPRSVINKVPQSAIGSVPLPPGDKGSVSSVSQAAKAIPMPSQPSAVVASVRPPDPTPVETVKPPPQTPPTVTKPTASSVVMPIGAKPIVVPGRPATLQPVGRVASVFLEKDDEPYEVPNSNRPPLPLPTSLASPDKLLPPPAGDKSKAHAPERVVDKVPGVAVVERPGHGRSQQPPVEPNRGRSKEVVPGPAPKGSSDSRQAASSEKPLGRAPQPRSSGKELAKSTAPGAPADRMPARNQLPGGDRPPARMPSNSEKITVKIVPLDREVSVRGSSSSQPAAKAALRPGESYMSRGGPPATKTDSATKHRTKRASSTDSSRSTSGSRSRSSSSVSHDSEHLYSDIASPISSASSLSPIRSPAVKPRLVQAVDKARIPPIKNSSGRLPAPPQASSAQYGMQRSSDGYRGGGGDQKGDRMPLSSSRPPQQSISSHMPSSRGAGRDIREGGGRDVGSREVSGRTVGSMGGVSHSRDAGMMESRIRSSSSSGHALQGNFPSSRNLDMHPSQKISSEKSSSHLPMPHSASNRKRPASPIGRFSPPSKTIRRAPEHKEPVKIPIPRHEKLTKLNSPPQRRRSDSNQAPMVSPLGKGPTTIPTKHPPPSAKPPSSASTSGGNASKRKGAMSRREELLMQLQAVEDAIAKKRSKMQ